MRSFDYSRLVEKAWDTDILNIVAKIHECKGRQDLFIQQKPVEFDRLVEIAKRQSTEASNRIEGIITTSTRLKQLNEEIHFITSNTRDFADPNDKEKLHPDLLFDLVEWKIPDSRFYYWNSLKSFIDTPLTPRTVPVDMQKAKEELIDEEYEKLQQLLALQNHLE